MSAEGVPDVSSNPGIVGYAMKAGLVAPMFADLFSKRLVLLGVEGKGKVGDHCFFLQDVEGSEEGSADAVK